MDTASSPSGYDGCVGPWEVWVDTVSSGMSIISSEDEHRLILMHRTTEGFDLLPLEQQQPILEWNNNFFDRPRESTAGNFLQLLPTVFTQSSISTDVSTREQSLISGKSTYSDNMYCKISYGSGRWRIPCWAGKRCLYTKEQYTDKVSGGK